jgi:murein L,D-transpeptidase YafK
MKRAILFLLLPIFLFSKDIVEIYRLHGMNGLEERLDQELSNPAYWQKALRNHDVRYGFFDTPTDLLLCTKSRRELALYTINGHLQLKEKTSIIIGQAAGDKIREGDMRTPIGVYHIVMRKTNLEEKYGPLAFVTDYPNRFDRIWGKNGHGIWLHGLPPGSGREKNATKGCIAVDNETLLSLDRQLSLDRALLVISEVPLQEVSKETMRHLLAFIYHWRYTWKYNLLHEYLENYSPRLVFQSVHDFNYFSQYKQRVFEKNRNQKKILRFSDLKVVPYPNSLGKKLWYVSFHEYYKSGGYIFSGIKKILIEETHPNHFKIIVE